MQRLTELALEKSPTGIFSPVEMTLWVEGTKDRRSALLKRALAAGEVVRIHRGLYGLAQRYRDRMAAKLDSMALAQRIHGPSYISLEMALSYHNWIPEAVYTITSVCADRSRGVRTPLGNFSFTRVPQKILFEEVVRIELRVGGSFLLAKPLKALADYIYVHKCDWDSMEPVVESLRVDVADLEGVHEDEYDALLGNYTSRRVQRFLRGLRKDLSRRKP